MVRAGPVMWWLWALLACATGHVTQRDVVFTQSTPLARNAELARRALPPLTYRRLQQTLARQHQGLADQAIDLAHEAFDVYVPDALPPPAGYGVIVFIAPWDEPTRPQQWRAALDRHGLIFVAAQRSGNAHSILDRRLPLAVLGYHNIRARYPVDPSRVYVWGFSGGSRTAELAALAYPDIFRGALLEAGSDPLDGSTGTYKPPAALFHQFQRSRLVFATGDGDDTAQLADSVAQASLRAACVFDLASDIVHGLGHASLDAVALDHALDLLAERHPSEPAALARCNTALAGALARDVAAAQVALGRGDRAVAQRLILAIDARYGGLAADDLAELDARLASLR